jgi:hypothetical protein
VATFLRANLKVKATLAPLEELPEDTGILVANEIGRVEWTVHILRTIDEEEYRRRWLDGRKATRWHGA